MSFAKPSPTESARLDEIVTRLSRLGYRADQIGAACGGISDTAIRKRARRLGLPRATSVLGTRPHMQPPHEHWLDQEVRQTAPNYNDSTTVQLCRSWLATLSQDNAVNRLAYDAADAQAAQDNAWLAEARATLVAAQAYLYRLLGVLENEELRRAAMTDPMQRDDVPRALRLIKRSG